MSSVVSAVTQLLYECLPCRTADLSLWTHIPNTGHALLFFFSQVAKDAKTFLSTVTTTTYLYIGMWLCGGVVFYVWDITSLYVIFTMFALIFMNLGERKEGELSAYSVFNEGFQELMGTMNANQIDQQLRHQQGRPGRGGGGGVEEEEDEEEDGLSDLLADDEDDDEDENTIGSEQQGREVEDGVSHHSGKLSYEERLFRRHQAMAKQRLP